jgi:hypothetical protein
MRFRITIRDLLWLTLVVALATSWWLDHRRNTGSVEPFSTQLSLIFGGGQEVHEAHKLQDHSPHTISTLNRTRRSRWIRTH